MNILFMHNNFPGQYRRIVKYLAQFPEYKMAVCTLDTNSQQLAIPRFNFSSPTAKDVSKDLNPYLRTFEKAYHMGQNAAKALLDGRKKGLRPDIILSHSGWGASMFAKDIFPDAKLLNYYEWYYYPTFSDADFFHAEPPILNYAYTIRMKNTAILHDLAAMDWGQSPTQFQASRLPEIFRSRVSVLHDGVDTEKYKPNPNAQITVADGKVLTADDEVITYVARGMEQYRGFPEFMAAVEKLQKLRPNLHIVMLGEDRVAYGANRKDGKTYKEWALSEFDFDMSRLHMMGLQPFDYFEKLMQVSSAHVYLTAPFVLSWSLMEAMSSGALIIASNTAPLREMITHGENGILTSFFDVDALVDQCMAVLDRPDDYAHIRAAARQTILDRYDTRKLLPQFRGLIETVANGQQPTL